MLTENQEKVMSALLTTRTQTEAAEAAGVSTRTIRNYLSDPEFKYEYQAMCAVMMQEAALVSQNLLCNAIYALNDMVTGDDVPPNIKLQAARTIIETNLKLSHYAGDVVNYVDMDGRKKFDKKSDELFGF